MRNVLIRTTFGLLAVAATLPVLAVDSLRAARDLDAFGPRGEAVSEMVRSFLPSGFFDTPMTDAMASGENFVAAVPVAQIEDGVGTLTVRNRAPRVNDIVVSTTDALGGDVRNFLVHLEVGEAVTVDLASVAGAARIYLLALQAFDASHTAYGERERLTVMAPAGATFGAGLGVSETKGVPLSSCTFASRTVTICGAGGCVAANARQNVMPHLPGSPVRARASVQYPVGGSLFHCSTNSSQIDFNDCDGGYYTTRRCDGTPYTHSWSGLDSTIRYCQPSSASCTSGCSGSFSVTC